MVEIIRYITIINLNVDGHNSPINKHRLAGPIKEQDTYIVRIL
jgi:hypothetical protein